MDVENSGGSMYLKTKYDMDISSSISYYLIFFIN